ncbi:MAG: AmmeMemoRadiSam system radical SAM enzyme [Desulfarculaceae bacterium]|jgi:pyruvate formate lyase activating enzyme
MHQAMLWEAQEENTVRCRLCAHGCVIKPGKRGICQVRLNQDGALYSLVWGKPISANPDPIEKKPLFHFLPRARSFSIATIGCNFRCAFCQNWQISQYPREQKGGIPGGGPGGSLVEPPAIIEQALDTGCASISYTYTEPTIYFEYAYDCMRLALDQGLKNVFVTNGYQSGECIQACEGLLHAANVDLKSFNDDFYKNECKARLQPVLDTLKRMHAAGIWLEVTTLLIPGKNDDPAELRDLAGFIAQELSPQVPWHVSAYTPRYKYSQGGPSSTPVRSLEKALEIGKKAGLEYLYAGNVPGHDTESTFCPKCGEKVISRRGFMVSANTLKQGSCPGCGAQVNGVWQ